MACGGGQMSVKGYTNGSTRAPSLRRPALASAGAKRLLLRGAAAPRAAPSSGAATDIEADVVVVGAGVIGLCIAHQILKQTQLSVALIDRQQPCAGATGAGQGYIWMSHRSPDTPLWELAARSRATWERFVRDNPELAETMEWQTTGSLLLATTAAEMNQLEARATMLQARGVEGVRLLVRDQVLREEPALGLPASAAGLLVESDAQISGRATAFALLDECQRLGAETGRCRVLLHEGATALEPAPGGRGAPGAGATAVTESGRRVRARRGVVVASGVWSGHLLADASGDVRWRALLAPRRGHLLELSRPEGMPPIRRGVMELSYTRHYSSAAGGAAPEEAAEAIAQAVAGPADALPRAGGGGAAAAAAAPSSPPGSPGGGGGGGSRTDGEDGGAGGARVDITFTATTSAAGALLIGSSREFNGWQAAPDADVMAAILQRAHDFVPALSPALLHAAAAGNGGGYGGGLGGSVGGGGGGGGSASVRVGLRPYALGGLPAIGPVPGLPGVYVAAGHEGSGLSLAPATADAVLWQLGEGGAGGGFGGELGALLPERRLAAAAEATLLAASALR